MLANDAMADAEPQTSAFSQTLGSEKGIKDLVEVIWSYSGPIVPDADLNLVRHGNDAKKLCPRPRRPRL